MWGGRTLRLLALRGAAQGGRAGPGVVVVGIGARRGGRPAAGKTGILAGWWPAHPPAGSPEHWFGSNPIAHVVQIKLGLLALTVALAVHARLRVIPRLSDESLPTLAWHIRIVTVAAVLFVLAGASVRFGGYPLFAH